jgi:hypothetical protein
VIDLQTLALALETCGDCRDALEDINRALFRVSDDVRALPSSIMPFDSAVKKGQSLEDWIFNARDIRHMLICIVESLIAHGYITRRNPELDDCGADEIPV